MRPRGAAGAPIQQLPVTFVWTHDSIGLGEDGPTHQPIEHLAALRAMPGPGRRPPRRRQRDRGGLGEILRAAGRPAGLALTRQNLPIFDRTAYANGRRRGQGRLRARRRGMTARRRPTSSSSPPAPRCSSPSRPALRLEKAGIATRVVSMPCREWFEEQDAGLPQQGPAAPVRARVSVEAGVGLGWRDFVGDAGRIISIEHFGASADAKTLFREFGFTPEAASRPPRTRSRPRRGRDGGSRPRRHPAVGPHGSLTGTTANPPRRRPRPQLATSPSLPRTRT